MLGMYRKMGRTWNNKIGDSPLLFPDKSPIVPELQGPKLKNRDGRDFLPTSQAAVRTS